MELKEKFNITIAKALNPFPTLDDKKMVPRARIAAEACEQVCIKEQVDLLTELMKNFPDNALGYDFLSIKRNELKAKLK